MTFGPFFGLLLLVKNNVKMCEGELPPMASRRVIQLRIYTVKNYDVGFEG